MVSAVEELRSHEIRTAVSEAARRRVMEEYTAVAVIEKIKEAYL